MVFEYQRSPQIWFVISKIYPFSSFLHTKDKIMPPICIGLFWGLASYIYRSILGEKLNVNLKTEQLSELRQYQFK